MFACIYIPDFPVAAMVRAEPWLHERPVAVLEGKPPQVRVVALNEKSRQLGMEIGMTKLQAEVFTAQTQEQTSAGKEVLRTRSSQIEFASQHNKRQPRMATA